MAIVKLPNRPVRSAFLKAVIRLGKLEAKVRSAVTQLRETGGGMAAAEALEEILSKMSHGNAFWLKIARFDMLSDRKNTFRQKNLFDVVDEINETMFAVAVLSAKLEEFRELLPDMEGLPDGLVFSVRGERAIHEIADLYAAACQFRSVIEEHYGKRDLGGPALTKKSQADPFDVLVDSLADVWLHSGRQLDGTDAKNFKLVLYVVYERLTGKSELPARRWKQLKPKLRKRTQPPQ
ncbi:hypothetical protein [Sneathiella sp.]|uniref:hypothetical protein n=1 Tax=Sneathiella sp. TaxID=1964365 RepID=UPI0035634422